MATAQQVSVDVREVTPEEVAAYAEQGWALLPNLISPELAAELLAQAKAKMGEGGDERTNTPPDDRNLQAFAKWYRLEDESDLYRAVRNHRQIGRNAALLMRRDMPIRSLTS